MKWSRYLTNCSCFIIFWRLPLMSDQAALCFYFYFYLIIRQAQPSLKHSDSESEMIFSA
ncbi:hypothetical protein BJX61DRAFT_518281 [Aspergillus egyptiacus]|nr:hypothetical protein BJX61DRAFT_518281 [Aspergillus egyptiacus]